MSMLPWREVALSMLPELADTIADAETPYLLWFDLCDEFDRAYEASPRDRSLIGRIYTYSEWCARAPRGDTAAEDLLTCVSVCFFEHIPEHPAAREDMPTWFTLDELLASREVFSYSIGEQEFLTLEDHFRKNRDRYVPRPFGAGPNA